VSRVEGFSDAVFAFAITLYDLEDTYVIVLTGVLLFALPP